MCTWGWPLIMNKRLNHGLPSALHSTPLSYSIYPVQYDEMNTELGVAPS